MTCQHKPKEEPLLNCYVNDVADIARSYPMTPEAEDAQLIALMRHLDALDEVCPEPYEEVLGKLIGALTTISLRISFHRKRGTSESVNERCLTRSDQKFIRDLLAEIEPHLDSEGLGIVRQARSTLQLFRGGES